jgi:hypothetical protein
MANILGRPEPVKFGHFDVVSLDNGAALDFARSADLFNLSTMHF